MLGRVDLREGRRLCDVGLMAARTDHFRVRQSGGNGSRIAGVLRQRPVARFAIHVRMFALAFGVTDISMATFAELMARIIDRARGDLAECSPSVMSILAKCFGDKQLACREEHDKACKKDGR